MDHVKEWAVKVHQSVARLRKAGNVLSVDWKEAVSTLKYKLKLMKLKFFLYFKGMQILWKQDEI